ncbi:MAG: rRNA maturation RNase YbeY [Chitinophagaceae bacterium]|nr:rRNA maturation RNase YbeY [Chitinophagaceae bacterium]
MPQRSSIEFFFQKKPVFLPKRTALKKFLSYIMTQEGRKLETLSVVFCSDEYLLNINLDFLKHHYYTDIISFDLSGPANPLQGEIYISVDRVSDNARTLKQTFKSELHRVIFHGVLHFCGYGDKKPGEKKKMRAMEDFYLQKYFK